MLDAALPQVNDETVEVAPRDPFFDPWRVPKGQNVKAIIADVLNQLGNYETYFRLRSRARRPDAQARHETIVARIVCGLIHRDLIDGEALAIPLGNDALTVSGRYASPVRGKQVPDILNVMATPEMAFAEVSPGVKGNPFKPGRLTTIQAGARLRTRIADHLVELADLAQDLDQETVVLKRERRDYWDNGDRIDYRDTKVTNQYRQEMRAINEWLAAADLGCAPYADDRGSVDPTDRLLRRYFSNGAFDQGGRLFGGFWQPLKTAQRLDGITISGEPVVELDYGQMCLRILYGMAGAVPPDGDLYDLPAFDYCRPHPRQAIKKVMAALMFVEGSITKWPRGTRDIRPKGVPVVKIIAALKEKHQPIAPLLEHLTGHFVFFRESQIMVELLLRLRDLGVIALPIHDAILVGESHESTAMETMLQVFRQHMGFDGVVTVERRSARSPHLRELGGSR